MKLPRKKYYMAVGTELHLPNSDRKGWKLIQYVTDDVLCVEASDGKQIQVYLKDTQLRYSQIPFRKKK